MKNLSFGKLIAIFGGFVVLIMIAVVVVMIANKKKNGGVPIITKRYNTADVQAQNQPPAQPAQPQPQPQPQRAPEAQQAALQAPNATGATQSTAQPPAAYQGAVQAAQSASAGASTAAQGDVGQQLASIDTKLTQFNARITALEAGHVATGANLGSGTAKTGAAPHARGHAVPTHHASKPRAQPVPDDENEPVMREATGYKSMAVVGNRAWVDTPDGREVNVAPGEQIPQPRPRVRSVDPNTGIVIMSSDERIESH